MNSCNDNSPHSIIEINNPESLVLFHKIVIPSALGDETQTPPYPGKYCNVLAVYEANGHSYLYSSDGIPTAISFTGGGILVVSDFPEVEQATIDTLYIKSDTGDAVITHDNQTWITINEPGGKVLLVEEFPQIADARKETLYILSKNGEARILDTDGTWLTLAGGGGGTGSVYFNNIINRPKIDGVEMTSDTDIPLSQITSDINSLSSTLSSKLNKYVVTDLNADTNPSTTDIKLKASRENLWDEHRETKTIPLPVASHTQAGIMNTATFNAVEQNKLNIEAMMNGAVAINNLPDPATQQQITDAWKNATGQTDLINHASVYDVTNNKVWTYYSNSDTWYPATNTTQVTVDTFTNASEGTILGSTNVGQVFAEPDGTGSVNGWDALSAQVSDNTDNISDIQTAVDGKQDKLTAGNAIIIDDSTGTISARVYPEDFFENDAYREGEGETFEMNDVAHLKIKNFKISGQTSQASYKGTNLLYAPYSGRVVGTWVLGNNWAIREEGSISWGGTPDGTEQRFYLYERAECEYAMPILPAGQYKMVAGQLPSGKKWPRIVVEAGGNTYYATYADEFVLNISNDILIDNIYFQVLPEQTYIDSDRVYPTLTPLSEFQSYQIYSGRQDSPNPQYPQRIKTVTGLQTMKAAGQNLYNYKEANRVTAGVTADELGYITFTQDSVNPNRFKNYWTNNLPLEQGRVYTLVAEVLNIYTSTPLSSYSGSISFASADATSQSMVNVGASIRNLEPGKKYVYTFTTKDDFSSTMYGIRTFATLTPGIEASITVRISVLATPTTPSSFVYQPFVGQTKEINFGKNLFDKNVAVYNLNQRIPNLNRISSIVTSNETNMIVYVPCSEYTSYAISDQSNIGLETRKIFTTLTVPNVGIKKCRQTAAERQDGVVLYTQAGAKYLAINYAVPAGQNIADKMQQIFDTLQIEEGTSVSDYSTYFDPLKLNKLGDAQDSVWLEGLSWHMRKETTVLKFDGTETNWTFNATNHSATIPHGGIILSSDALCPHFMAGDATTTNNTFLIDDTSITFKSDETITSLQDWKDWLAENKLEVYAKLVTPTEEIITNPDIVDTLVYARNTVTYPGTTFFSMSSQMERAGYLEITAYKNSLEGFAAAIRDIPICC